MRASWPSYCTDSHGHRPQSTLTCANTVLEEIVDSWLRRHYALTDAGIARLARLGRTNAALRQGGGEPVPQTAAEASLARLRPGTSTIRLMVSYWQAAAALAAAAAILAGGAFIQGWPGDGLFIGILIVVAVAIISMRPAVRRRAFVLLLPAFMTTALACWRSGGFLHIVGQGAGTKVRSA